MATPIVWDSGSQNCKVGFAGEKSPTVVFENVVGKPTHRTFLGRGSLSYFGDEAIKNRGVLKLVRPIGKGIVNNRYRDDLADVWNYIYENKLKLPAKDHPVLFAYAPVLPAMERNKLAEIAFQKLKVPFIYLANQAVLALHACNRSTGIVVESGHGATNIVAIHEGRVVSGHKAKVAGSDVTDYLSILLVRKAGHLDIEVVTKIKENTTYVALDYEPSNYTAETFEIPGGEKISIGKERYMAPEILFNPRLIAYDAKGIHEAIEMVISESPAEAKKEMYANIILSGGNTMFPGLAERLEKEVKALAGSGTEVKVIPPPGPDVSRKNLAWYGGSLTAKNINFPLDGVSRDDYEKMGLSAFEKFN